VCNRSMLNNVRRLLLAMLTLTIVIPISTPRTVSAQSDDGLIGGERYESPQFGYVVTWDDPWSADERATRSRTNLSDRLVLEFIDAGAELTISGRFDDGEVGEALGDMIEERTNDYGDVTVSDQAERDDIATVSLTYVSDAGEVAEHLEVQPIDAGESVLVVSLVAPLDTFGEVLDALALVEIDGGPVFREEPVAPGASGDVADRSTRRRPDFSSTQPTEEETEEADPDAAIDGNTFTSPNFNFSLSWDEDVWEVEDVSLDPDFDQLLLDSGIGSVSFSGTNSFGGDARDCLAGVTGFLAEDTSALEIEDIDVFEDEDGNPIEGEERDRAFVANEYTATFQGDDVNFIYYVECRTLVRGETDLVILQFVADPDDYPDEAVARDEIIDTLEIEGTTRDGDDVQTPTPSDDEPTATPADEEEAETPSADEEGTFESDTYGFSLSWDSDIWEETSTGDDGVALDDGPSTLTIMASEEYEGDSVACVQGQLDEIRGIEGVTNVEAETGENGRRISGGDSERFFALYRVTASDGTFGGTNDVLVYLECRTLVEDDIVLVVSHIIFNPDLYEREAARAEDVLETIETQE
jgi:hypothetical protein